MIRKFVAFIPVIEYFNLINASSDEFQFVTIGNIILQNQTLRWDLLLIISKKS